MSARQARGSAAQDTASALSPDYAQAHGCAWVEFTQPDDPASTRVLASVAGQPAVAIDGTAGLDRRVLWWTNLTQAQAWMLGRWQNIKPADLLCVPLPVLLSDHGQDHDAASVALWSETLARMGGWLSEESAGAGAPPWDWGDGSLSDALAHRWGWAGEPASARREDPMQPILAAAWAATIRQPPPRHPEAYRRVSFGLPRVSHVNALWRERVPQGDFAPVPPALFPKDLDQRMAWVTEQRRPTLVRIVAVHWKPGQEATGRVWMGLRDRKFPSAEPDPVWVTGEEAASLARFARLELDMPHQAGFWTHMAPPVAWLDEALKAPLGQYSLTLGLLGFSAWRAAAGPSRQPKSRARQAVTAQSIWQRAADRRECFEAALPLLRRGVQVVEYGHGRVDVALPESLPEGEVLDLARAFKEAGFILPRLMAARLPLDSSAEYDNPVDVAHWVLRAGAAQAAWDIDRLVATWLGPAAEVKAVLHAALTGLMAMDTAEVPHWKAWWTESLRAQLQLTTERLRAAAARRRG